MILAINYADDKYKVTQKFNSKRALRFGADKVREYSPDDLEADFREKNNEILNKPRGGGYWAWKPWIILDALNLVAEGDYVVYTDSGSAFVNKMSYLLKAMQDAQTDIMVFCLTHLEKYYTKRDAFILLDCDEEKYTETPQICGTYIIIRKTVRTVEFVNEYLEKVQDWRIVGDDENVLGQQNYQGFVDHRHDQSILSLLCKKHGIKPFRDPSQYGLNKEKFSVEVNRRSTYPQIIESHRNPTLDSFAKLKYKKWYRFFDIDKYKMIIIGFAVKIKALVK